MKIALFSFILTVLVVRVDVFSAEQYKVDTQRSRIIEYTFGTIPVWEPVLGKPRDSKAYLTWLFGDRLRAGFGIFPGGNNRTLGVQEYARVKVFFSDKWAIKKLRGVSAYSEKIDIRKPPNHLTSLKIWIDGDFYIDQRILHPYLRGYSFYLPFPAGRVDAEGTFAEGGAFKTGIKVPPLTRGNPDYDTRQKPMAARRLWDTVQAGIIGHCVSSPESGPLKSFIVTLKKHRLFAPDGDQVISDVRFHMPVYQYLVSSSWEPKLFVPRSEMHQWHSYTLYAECTTEKGVTFTQTREVKVPGETFPSGS